MMLLCAAKTFFRSLSAMQSPLSLRALHNCSAVTSLLFGERLPLGLRLALVFEAFNLFREPDPVAALLAAFPMVPQALTTHSPPSVARCRSVKRALSGDAKNLPASLFFSASPFFCFPTVKFDSFRLYCRLIILAGNSLEPPLSCDLDLFYFIVFPPRACSMMQCTCSRIMI